MNSEFYHVPLDQVRYSLVWEDSQTLYAGLEINPEDKVLVITSAGCNVLNTLLQNPAQVTAIDINPVQNQLLSLKQHIILHHDYPTFRALLGIDGPEKVKEAWPKLEATLPEYAQSYWNGFFESNPNGLLTVGKLEKYLNGFLSTLSLDLQEKFCHLLHFREVAEQHAFFMKELHASAFKAQFIHYFDEANLSKGRDPKLFKYSEESGGQSFYNRLVKQLSCSLVSDNFFFRFFFFGIAGMPTEVLPPCYRPEHFDALKRQLPKLSILTGEATDYLLTEAGQEITKASLSNIFEYTSQAEFNRILTQLLTHPTRSLRLIFWNLLQDQGATDESKPWRHLAFDTATPLPGACFYFKNVRVFSNKPALHRQKTSTMTSTNFFSPAYVQELMRQRRPGQNILVHDVQPLEVDNSASILVALTAGRTERQIGHFGLSVKFAADGIEQTRRMVMKIKPNGQEISEMLNSLAQACGGELAEVYPNFKTLTGFHHTHGRELEVYANVQDPLMPEIFGLQAEPEHDVYIILMEYLEEVDLLNSVMAPHQWTDIHIKTALQQVAQFHANNLEQEPRVEQAFWTDRPSKGYMLHMAPLWKALLANATEKFPELYPPTRLAQMQEAIDTIPEYWEELATMPHTFVHNDLNPRNSCFKTDATGQLQFCVYDWELSTFHVPQYDVVELLSFVLEEDRYHLREEYLEFYRQHLHSLTGLFNDKDRFNRGFQLTALDFGLHRLGMYLMAHSVSPYPFLPRVVNSLFHTLAVHPVQVV